MKTLYSLIPNPVPLLLERRTARTSRRRDAACASGTALYQSAAYFELKLVGLRFVPQRISGAGS